MGQLITSPDVCERLRLDLLGSARLMGVQLDAACTPLPQDMPTRLPFAWIRALGGTRRDLVIDETMITVGVYAATWATALDAARVAHAILLRLPYEHDALTSWKRIDALNLPYEDPDPDRPDLARISFTLTVTCKATVSSIPDTTSND
ncbi:hypothetical protein EMO89_01675 [Bifidobacterium tissieri]|uniref:DUF3168 domain-containing protein n=1 Tax=Bifidobacterium tissieri TaxID=1630162 RepID=A0A5M9ZV77_9BIFI|nr:hypothetical protein [Bifidobacterium tissieri]KAA8831470.1 hypothetical protein EMO89_01675 [Bifidobacterium tissieri]